MLKLLTQLCPEQAAAAAHPVVQAAAVANNKVVVNNKVATLAVPLAVPLAVRVVPAVEAPPPTVCPPAQILAAKFRLAIRAVEPHLPVLIRGYRCIEELLAVQQQQPAQHGFLFAWVDV